MNEIARPCGVICLQSCVYEKVALKNINRMLCPENFDSNSEPTVAEQTSTLKHLFTCMYVIKTELLCLSGYCKIRIKTYDIRVV